MRAIGYFRETQRGSLAEQSRSFLEFCRGNGYEAAAAFLDGGGAEDGLPGFRQMVEFVKQQGGRGFLLVAVPNLTSLGDAPTEAARRYFQLASLGVPVVCIESGQELAPMLLERWGQQRTNGRLGEKVRAAMRRKAVKGEALGRPPYGYRVGPKRRLVVVAEEGSVVRYIFRLYLKDGLGIRRIARRLNEESLRTRRSGLWSMVTVRDILRNRAYVGTYTRFGVRVPASHAPLISQEDFRRVQERLDQRRPAAGSRQVSPFLLSGLAYCGYCGNKMIGVTRKQRWRRRSDDTVRSALYRYYQCESRTNRSLCDYHTRRAERLEEEVRAALVSGQSSPAVPQAGDGAAVRAETEGQVRRLRDKVRRLDRRLEQYLDAASAGRLSEERLRSLSLALASQQLELEEGLVESQRLAQQQATEAERRRQQEGLLASLEGDWERLTFGQRQELLREVLDRVVVRDDGIDVLLRL
ncbi:MAG TPA: recombinase family protein [Dehalococcoidia bacterium]|nr:recombinase family protein [Dehalococcoidia bacterium]